MNSTHFLIGNSFPFSLVRRRVEIEPRPIGELRKALDSRPWKSFWGHGNTIPAANAMLGIDVTPATKRPAVILSEDNRPVLDGTVVSECWILSPNYTPGFRPAPNEEVQPEKITGWHALRMRWI